MNEGCAGFTRRVVTVDSGLFSYVTYSHLVDVRSLIYAYVFHVERPPLLYPTVAANFPPVAIALLTSFALPVSSVLATTGLG